MPNLTRYTSFEKLKADSVSVRKKNAGRDKDLKDFEHFFAYLRQSSTLKKRKAKQSEASNE